MSLISISVNIKNPAEVLACYGLLALDFLLDRQILRSRFLENKVLKAGVDGTLRSGMFEFEHPDFAGFLNRCRDMKLSVNGKEHVRIESDDKTVLTLDWYQGTFLGDLGNFSQMDNKLTFVQTHQKVLAHAIESMQGGHDLQDYSDLFSTIADVPETNYLASYSTRKKNYQDAGGVYEAQDVFYASEWFLLIALQVFRNVIDRHLYSRYCVRYSIFTEWLSISAALAAAVSGHPSCKMYESSKRNFGKGSVLQVGREIT